MVEKVDSNMADYTHLFVRNRLHPFVLQTDKTQMQHLLSNQMPSLQSCTGVGQFVYPNRHVNKNVSNCALSH